MYFFAIFLQCWDLGIEAGRPFGHLPRRSAEVFQKLKLNVSPPYIFAPSPSTTPRP